MPSSLLTEPPLNPTHEPFHVDRILKPAEPLPQRDHKVIAVLPAYNAAADARRDHRRLPARLRG